MIANFGFFDLDAAFSAAFVFVLVDSIYSHTGRSSSVENIRKASEILNYLSSQGNKAAEKRGADINQMCNHLGVSFHENLQNTNGLLQDNNESQGPETELDGTESGSQQNCEQRPLTDNRRREDVHITECTLPQQELSPSQFDWAQAAATFFDQNLSDPQDTQKSMAAALSFGEGGNEICSSLYLDDFSLTGVVETDWAELGKQLASQNELL